MNFQISRSLKSLVILLILAISAAGVQLCLDGKIFAATQDDINDEMVLAYGVESDQKDLIDMFGSRYESRRSNFSAGLYGAGWYYMGDLGGSKWFPAVELDIELFSNKPIALNLNLGYGTIGTKQNYEAEIAVADDVRVFVIFLGAIFNQVYLTLAVIAVVMNVETIRRMIICRDHE